MDVDKILRDGEGVFRHIHGFQLSILAKRSSESLFKIFCGRIQKIFRQCPNHSPTLHQSIHLSLQCLSAPYNLQVTGSESFVIRRPVKQRAILSALRYVLKSIRKYFSMAGKFLIKEHTLFVIVTVEFVTIAGNPHLYSSTINRISTVRNRPEIKNPK